MNECMTPTAKEHYLPHHCTTGVVRHALVTSEVVMGLPTFQVVELQSAD